MKQTPKQVFISLFCTFVYALALSPVSYAVDGCSSPGFRVATTINLETVLFAMAAADFNGDGHLDLAAAPNNGGAEVILLLGRGGTDRFGPPITYAAGGSPRRIGVGDFNGDGRPDLAVSLDTSGSTGRLSILLNDGTGKFGVPNIISLQGHPSRPVVDDVNNDGKLDIVTALSTGGTEGKVAVLLGNGTGGFSHAANSPFFTLRVNAYALVLGDFNEDGKRDLAVPNSAGRADIMLGDGTGGFAPLSPSQITGGSLSMTPGDFNEDGHLDLLIDSRMFLGTGAANFSAPIVVGIPGDSNAGLAADVNHDGHLDAVVAGPSGLTIMLGNGTGNLIRGNSYASGHTIYGGFAVPGDFNEDGEIDLAAVQTLGIGILEGDGTGAFYDARNYQTTIQSPNYLVAADFNSDGKQDFVVAAGTPNDRRIEVAHGDGNGGFTLKSLTHFGIWQLGTIAAADFNNDTKPDLAVTVPLDGRVFILLNDGTGGFPTNGSTQSYLLGGRPSAVETGDFNNDNKVDLVVLRSNSNGLHVLYGDGAGAFTVQTFTPLPSTTAFSDVVVSDFNADGKFDLAVSGFDLNFGPANYVRILTGNGAGIFPSFTDVATAGAPGSLVARDLNGDSKPDIAVPTSVSSSQAAFVTVIFNNAPSGFSLPIDYSIDGIGILGVGDFNNDTKPDLALSSGNSILGGADGITLFTNQGNGNFNARVNVSAGKASGHLAVSDFNNDGKEDVIVSQFSNSVALLLNDFTGSQPCLSVNDVTVTEGDSGTIDAVFTVALSAPSAQTVRVNYFALNLVGFLPPGSPMLPSTWPATKGTDFEVLPGTLTFLPGQTMQTISVTVKADLIDEIDEYFRVVLTTPINANISDGRGTGTILDDDAPPSISIDDIAADEGSPVNFTLSLSAPSEKPISIQYATVPDTASANVDYGTASGTISFAMGEVTKTISVSTIQDNIFELHENFFVNLFNPTFVTIARGQGNGIIANNDPLPSITIGNSSRSEGAAGTSGNSSFNVNLSNASYQTITVSFATADVSATAGSDYVATSGTVTFNPGETTKSISVEVSGDNIDEVIEQYVVNLTNPTNATIATAQGTGTITDDDGPTLSLGNASVTEGHSGFINAVFTVTLSAPSVQSITVNYATVGGTATSNLDFQRVVSNTLFIPAGAASGTFNIRVFGDFEIESDEQFTVNLQNSSNATIAPGQGTGTGTILNDDSHGKLQFSSPTYSVTENAGSAVISVSRIDGATGMVTVDYATSNGTATAGSDYTATSGTLTFSQGEISKTFSIPITSDGVFEVSETVNLTLSNPTGSAVLGTTSTAVLTINTPPLFLILEEPRTNPGQVAAIDSVSLLRDPFSVLSMIALYPAADRNTRVTVFVTNLQLAPTDVASSVKVRLTDSNNQTYEVGAENVGAVPGLGFTQITFRLPDNLSVGTVNVKVVAHDQESNQATFRIQN